MQHDFNAMERDAKASYECGDFETAKRIYYSMADGDLSLDAGYLGHKIGACYEALGQLQEAKYWYGRAVEENPDVDEYRQSRGRIKDMSVERYVKGE